MNQTSLGFTYHIEKGDSYIEPANITGQLIINNLSEGLTLTPTVIDVELIADYPNQLCYDGKSYAVAYGLPILTDYTVAVKLDFLNMEEVANFAGTIKFTNVV